jgi:hypothetical protein
MWSAFGLVTTNALLVRNDPDWRKIASAFIEQRISSVKSASCR